MNSSRRGGHLRTKRRIRFNHQHNNRNSSTSSKMSSSTSASAAPAGRSNIESKLAQLNIDRNEVLTDEDDDNFVYSPTTDPRSKERRRRSSKLLTPGIYLNPPPLHDQQPTPTTVKQDTTMRTVMKHLDQTPLPNLARHAHVQFLLRPLEDGLKSGYTMLDASRPWMLYWCLNGLAVLGEDLGIYHEQLIASLKPLQSPLGGFGGGNQQHPHLAATYAAILSLTVTSYFASLSEEDHFSPSLYSETFSWIDRVKLLNWLRSLKLPNGGFKVNAEGEEDVRAGYCALVVCALMGYDDDELRGTGDETPLLDGVAEYFSRCQSWEGGIGAKPGAEAHGGYAFCVVAGLCLLGEPYSVLTKYLNLDNLISWLSARQYAPEGGLSGRTNKLVDGCYSTWVGGCWSLVEAAADGQDQSTGNTKADDDVVENCLWSREGLIRYIMTCCQDETAGGLRDKPGVRPDQYHSNYVLIGLSSAQHHYYYVNTPSEDPCEGMNNFPFKTAFRYAASKYMASGTATGEEESIDEFDGEDLATRDRDRVEMQHPVFNVPLGAEVGVIKWWRYWKESTFTD